MLLCEGIKDGYETKLRELHAAVENKEKVLRDLEARSRRVEDEYSN